MGNAFWLIFLLVSVQFQSSSQQLTFARSWVRGEFANDEDGGGGNQDYDSNINQPQHKRAKAFYMRAPGSWNAWPQSSLKDSLQSDNTEENTLSGSHYRFPNWNCQLPHFYRYNTRSRDSMPFRHPHV